MDTPPTTPPIPLSSPIGLVAGNGRFPLEFAENARAHGLAVVTIAIKGEADPRIEELSKECTWVRIGQLGKLLKTLRRSKVRQAALAGGVTRVNFVDGFHMDWHAVRMLARMRSFNDDSMLRNIIREIEAIGVSVIAASTLLEKSVPKAGLFTKRKLSQAEIDDARIGWTAARALGDLDIGQAVIVRNKTVIAVEAVEGTEEVIKRAGLVRGQGGVLIKLAKTIQDLRIDLPAVGLKTIDQMQGSRLSAIVLEAEKSIMLDPQDMVRAADAAGIAILAASSIEDLKS